MLRTCYCTEYSEHSEDPHTLYVYECGKNYAINVAQSVTNQDVEITYTYTEEGQTQSVTFSRVHRISGDFWQRLHEIMFEDFLDHLRDAMSDN